MKLAFNQAEVQEAVSQFVVNNGFPIDLTNAEFESHEDGSVTIELTPQDKSEAPAPKPKAKRPAAKAAAKEKVEPAVMPEPEKTTAPSTEADDDLFAAPSKPAPAPEVLFESQPEESSDLILDELDEVEATVEEDNSADNSDFSLFANG